MTERVLVTGASGFIAGHCIRDLLDQGYAVRGTVRDLTSADKIAHLYGLADGAAGELELVEADLSSDDGWPEAVAGCDYVLHVASPFPSGVPDDEDELIRPAVDGTLRVLRACAASGTVRRVVLTSSVAAISSGHSRRDPAPYTEHDWSVVEHSTAYQKSKTLAERAAWDYVAELAEAQRFELAVINPGLVLGPVQTAAARTSVNVVRTLLARAQPGSPAIGFAVVDVRDLAVAHRHAMTLPHAAGHRYICAGDNIWMRDIAKTLAAEFNPRGFRVPTGSVPRWLVWIAARFDPTMRLALELIGRPERVDSTKARRELNWQMRPTERTIIDTAESLIEHGVVTPARRRLARQAATA
ncbi:SDR family oxidoreductase [Phytoactinopolyspora halotolerans]|uniref:Aldehyde reductase n=1 Tax=Phytoactinopolyspora halotolerans TaxID=1981512 RepID=A0A6L9SDZ3_9ACTN|nr:aldehyde reductase [Phytoactinopolyspora halotolerans]NEE02834.1 aldehyde reductase [Phytoactinopolyspora halotolerans]